MKLEQHICEYHAQLRTLTSVLSHNSLCDCERMGRDDLFVLCLPIEDQRSNRDKPDRSPARVKVPQEASRLRAEVSCEYMSGCKALMITALSWRVQLDHSRQGCMLAIMLQAAWTTFRFSRNPFCRKVAWKYRASTAISRDLRIFSDVAMLRMSLPSHSE